MMRPFALALAFVMIASAQSCSYSPQDSYPKAGLTVWAVACTGFHADIPAASIYAAGIAHGIGWVSSDRAAVLLSTAQGKSAYSKILVAISVLAGAGAVGAAIDASSAGWAKSPKAQEIAASSAGVALVAGIVLPQLQAHAPAQVPIPAVLGDLLVVGSTGRASTAFFSRQSGAAFTAPVQ